jgi:hypothetical protein
MREPPYFRPPPHNFMVSESLIIISYTRQIMDILSLRDLSATKTSVTFLQNSTAPSLKLGSKIRTCITLANYEWHFCCIFMCILLNVTGYVPIISYNFQYIAHLVAPSADFEYLSVHIYLPFYIYESLLRAFSHKHSGLQITQDSQCTYNVTLRRYLEMIFRVEKQ